MKICTLNKIDKQGIDLFDSSKYQIGDSITDATAVILRSFNMHETQLPDTLLAVARAGAGTNNIPIDQCSQKGVVVFNTPGANANAVCELTIAALLLSSRKIVDGINWAKTLEAPGIAAQVEKGKSQFAGPELLGKKILIVGLGAIGVMVANACHALGMEVFGYDPFVSVSSALSLSRSIKIVKTIKEIVDQCHYISLHAPLNKDTKEMIDQDFLANVMTGVRIANFSRAELVSPEALAQATESGRVACYVTDFPNDQLLGVKNVLPIPHLGASTPESETNCATMAAAQLIDFLENGNIVNSVNFANCEAPRSTDTRVCVVHKNIPNMLGQCSSLLAGKSINIDSMKNSSKKDYAYTIMDVDNIGDNNLDQLCDAMRQIEGIISVRVIK